MDEGALRWLFAVIAAVVLLAAAHAAAQLPFYQEHRVAANLLNGSSVADIAVVNDTMIYAAVESPKPRLYLVKLDQVVHVKPVDTRWIDLPSPPVDIDYVSGKNSYLAALLKDNTIVITDPMLRDTWHFAVKTRAEKMVATESAVYILASSGPRLIEPALYAIVPGRLGWSEARVVVGTLLDRRLENVRPLQLSHIDGYDGVLVLYEAVTKKPYIVYVKLGVKVNDTLTVPAAGANVLAFYMNTTTFLGSGVVDENGTLKIGLEKPPVRPIALFIEYNGTCYKHIVEPADLTNLGNEEYTYAGVLIVNQGTVLAKCPPKPSTYRLAIFRASPSGFNYTDLPVRVQSYAFRILDAYVKDNVLYVWVYGALAALPDLEATGTDQGIAYLAIDLTNLEIIDSRYYIVDGNTVAAIHSEDRGLETIPIDRALYIASGIGDSYNLTWSLPLPDPVSDVSIWVSNNTYFVAAATGNKIALAGVNTTRVWYLPLSSNGAINAGVYVTRVTLLSRTLFAATSNGLLVVDNLVLGGPGSIGFNDISTIMPTTITLNIVDAVNESSVCSKVTYRLMAFDGTRNVTLEERTVETCGPVGLTCMPGTFLLVKVSPLSRFYLGASSFIPCPAGNTTISLDRVSSALTIVLIDGYTGGVPLPNGNITVEIQGIDTNVTASARLVPGESSVAFRIPAGIYRVRISDGLLYAPNETTIVVVGETARSIVLDRIPVTVRIFVRSTATAAPPDSVNVTVVTQDGRVLYETGFESPQAGRAVVVEFETKYRGLARVLVETSPGPGARAVFFNNASALINITDTGARADITLEPRVYRISVQVVAADSGEPVEAIIRLVRDKTLVAKVKGIEAVFNVTRGRYVVDVAPLPDPKYNLTVYANTTATIEAGPDKRVVLPVPRVRAPLTLIIKDPYALGNVTADDLEVYLDGILFAEVKAGEPAEPIMLLPRLTGSKLEIRSVHGIYESYKKTVKPGKKPLVAILNRRIFSVTISVVNDVGQGVGAAQLDITGKNLNYVTSTNTDDQGKAVVPLPYGSYQICVTAPGYYPACSDVTVTGDMETTIVLLPQPLTLVLRYMPLIITVIIAVVLVVLVRRYFRRLVERLGAEEEF